MLYAVVRKFSAVALVLAAAGLGAPVFATDGHQLIGLGAVQLGTGGAGVATPKDSTWVLLNPASTVDLEHRFDFSFEVFAPYRYIEPHGPLYLPMANHFAGKMTDDSIFFIPAMGAIFPHDENDTFGIGLFAVNGMGVDYDHSRTMLPRLFGNNFDRRTQYGVMKLGLSYAHRFDNGWALGTTLSLDYSMFQTDMMTLKFRQTDGSNDPDGGLGVGLTIGAYKTWDRLSFGAAYSTPHLMQTYGKYKDLLPLHLNLPQTFQAGFGYRITPKVEVALDYKFLGWSSVEQIGKKPIKGGFGWHDQHTVKAGVTWQVNDKWTLRGGTSYGNSPIDEEVAFANGLFPAVIEAHATAGVSYALNEKTDLHFAYEHAFGNKVVDSGKGDVFSFAGKGTEIYLAEDTFTFEYSHKF